jgi:hypothetical protein
MQFPLKTLLKDIEKLGESRSEYLRGKSGVEQGKEGGSFHKFACQLPCSPERNSVSIIRIRLREVIKC